MANALKTILIALTVNLLLFFLLSELNGVPSIEPPRAPEAPPRYTVLKTPEPLKREEVPEEEMPPVPEILTVDLDLPPMDALPVEPVPLERIDLDLSDFRVDVPVVAPKVAVKAAPAARPRKTEKKPREQAPMRDTQVDAPPRELTGISPKYPREALRSRRDGWVKARLLIDERGRVQDVTILEVEGHPSFRRAFLDAARKWRFEPARHRGKTVSVWGVKTIRFEVERD